MKRFTLVYFLLALSLCMVSCSKDDDTAPEETIIIEENTIVGKWEYFKVALQKNDSEFIPYYELFGHKECGKNFLTFEEDNTGQSVFFNKNENDICYTEKTNYEYSLSDDILIFTQGEFTRNQKFEFLNNQQIKITYLETTIFVTTEYETVLVSSVILKRV